MKLFFALTIFICNWHIITCIEMLRAPQVNEPNRGFQCECSRRSVERSGQMLHSQQGLNAAGHPAVVHPISTSGAMEKVQTILWDFLFVQKRDAETEMRINTAMEESNDTVKDNPNNDHQIQYPSGRIMHSELFKNKSSVHLPAPDLLHTLPCRLRITDDYLQTAVDAFAIILEGNMADVLALPSSYVLRSARTISIMKIPLERLSAMWDVVLAGRDPNTITYETLEIYRPLFKYLNGNQISRLNLSNSRIVNYIGTHPELTRHQVGVVANRYIKMNKHWQEPKYLNNMNNLLCGVPMTFMRKIPDAAYLKLEHQVFYHIRACDPLQRRFYLNMITRTQALGKPFSWSARDVSRLGLLLAEVEGPSLAGVSPEAMAGISSHVMAEMRPESLKYITEFQIKYIKSKALNIMSRKLKEYDASMVDTACRFTSNVYISLVLFAINNIAY